MWHGLGSGFNFDNYENRKKNKSGCKTDLIGIPADLMIYPFNPIVKYLV